MANETSKSIEEAAAEHLVMLKKTKAERAKLDLDTKKQRAQRLVSNTLFLVLALMLGGVIFSTLGLYYFAVLIIMGLLPSLVAYVSDMRPKKLGSKTVFAMNFTGIIPQITSVLTSGSPDEAAKSSLEDPMTWVVMYGFALLGWGLIYIIPNIIHLFMEIRADYAIKRLKKEQENLVEEWGEPVKKLVNRVNKRVKAKG